VTLLAGQSALAIVAVETVQLPRSGNGHARRMTRATENLFLYAALVDIEPHDSAGASVRNAEGIGIRPLSKPRH
jgi:hypothetical protein